MEDTLRRQHEEDQYARRMGTRTGDFAAYQTEAQTQVGVAGDEALGKMGSNGAGGVDLGSGGAGFNPAAMMAGMAVGGAVGQNITGILWTVWWMELLNKTQWHLHHIRRSLN